MPLTDKQVAALAVIAEAAVSAERMSGCPAELMAAQCILESGWLRSAPGNNCFGIKSYSGASGRQLLRTKEYFTDDQAARFLALRDGRKLEPAGDPDTEGRRLYNAWDWFATFPTLAACFVKRGMMFSAGRYAHAADVYRKTSDIAQLVQMIAPIYATSPSYGSDVMKIINMPEVRAALDAAWNGRREAKA